MTACAIQVPIVIVIVSNLHEVFSLRLLSSNCRDETVNAPYIASTPDGWVYIYHLLSINVDALHPLVTDSASVPEPRGCVQIDNTCLGL